MANPLTDARRLGLAIAYPGIDSRSWATAGRVEEGGIHWDSGVGWIIDVKPYGGQLEDSDGMPVRVLSAGPGGSGFGEYIPPSVEAEVLVVMTEGDPESNPALIGYLTNEDDSHPPYEVTGLAIDSEATTSTDTAVSPYDTEIKRSPFHRREEWAGKFVGQAKSWEVISDKITLGGANGAQPALLGQTTVDNTNELLQALNQLAGSLSGLSGPLAPLQAIGAALTAALAQLGPKISGQLSDTLKLK
jgi:hypothetical protein